MSFDALTNRGEYFSPYFIEEILPGEIRKNISTRWAEREKAAQALESPEHEQTTPTLVLPAGGANLLGSIGPELGAILVDSPAARLDTEPAGFATAVTPRAGLREFRRYYYERKSDLLALDPDDDAVKRAEVLQVLHDGVLGALGFPTHRYTRTVIHGGVEVAVPLAADVHGVWAVECGWATEADAAVDLAGAGRLLHPVVLGPREMVTSGIRLASHLFVVEEPPRYVLLLAGGVVILADRRTWGEGRYLAASLDTAFSRHDAKPGGEIDVIAALFGADALCPPETGGAEPLADLLSGSRKQAVGVTAELRVGLQESVELIANEVLARLAEAGVRPEQIDDLTSLGDRLTREALRYLYRILVLLYAEARPELGMLPVDHPEYAEGYSLARLGDLAARRPPTSPAARTGTHLFDSLNLLFKAVNEGYHAHGTSQPANSSLAAATAVDSGSDSDGSAAGGRPSEREGIRFEALRSDLFEPSSITLIGQSLSWPENDDEDGTAPAGRAAILDTRLRNDVLYAILRRLMITKGGRRTRGGARRRGGFISYRQLGIPQLGAVYEGLMSYTGFIAGEALYEVAKGGDPKDGSWTVPTSRADEYPPEVFVHEVDEDGHRTDRRRRYPAGSFVYRLSGRDRQTSASYYTPQSLTEVTVQLALQYRIKEAGPDFKAREMLDWTICEPALGSGAFLNEAINQVAAEYLSRRQEEKRADGTLDEPLDPERYAVELQKVKAYIALHNSYGVDLNPTAIELADVSLWLNVMHAGLQAPWFGLHLRRGNSLVGAGRRYYTQDTLADRSWLTSAPVDHPFRDGDLPKDAIHHFLLPAAGWGAVAAEKEAKDLAEVDAKKLAAWRRVITKAPTTKAAKGKPNQAAILAALTRRAEYLWTLVQQRLALSEAEIRRQIDVWGAEDLPEVRDVVPRAKILADLEAPGTPYWRLKKLMDTWCALWFWPVDSASLLDGTAPDYQRTFLRVTNAAAPARIQPTPIPAPALEAVSPRTWETASMFGDDGTIENAALIAPEAGTTSPAGKRQGNQSARPAERLRGPFPLANLDDWIRFATALIGTADVGQNTFATHFSTLDELETHEEDLATWLGQEAWHRLAELFPWLDTVETAANQHGFFHWEVEFSAAFADGGFDLQVGNPPWVRPNWHESSIYAEADPWFALSRGTQTDEWKVRREGIFGISKWHKMVIHELTANAGFDRFLSDVTNYPLLAGTQPDLYRGFMCRAWLHAKPTGTVGMIHPDSHLDGVREKRIRKEAFPRLRAHAHFVNVANWAFADLSRTQEFGLHIYGPPQSINFMHAAWIFDASVLSGSLIHDNNGPAPGIKHNGSWDLRPHRQRIIVVNHEVLREWQLITGESAGDIFSARVLYLVGEEERSAISALAAWKIRLGDLPMISPGYHETGAQKRGIIRKDTGAREQWRDVILRGPQIAVGTPIAKQPPALGSHDESTDLTRISNDFVPASDFTRNCPEKRYFETQDIWAGRPYTSYYRLAWRRRIATNGERSLFAAILPPGPAHVDSIHSLTLPTKKQLVLAAGFWSALPLDYLMRASGRGDLRSSDVRVMPTGESEHPLMTSLLLRTLRLNCLTEAYEELWHEVYDPVWKNSDKWAIDWPKMAPLERVDQEWSRLTPLRSEYARRAALVELDALVSVWLGISADALAAIYKSRFPQIFDYESEMFFDAHGRKISANFNSFGHGQIKQDWIDLQAHFKSPHSKVPSGYSPPFYKADRENEMRAAHAVFSKRLEASREEGWRETSSGWMNPVVDRGTDTPATAQPEPSR
ncbi:hypothetical protein [Frankia sp. R82]|uniref:hypothetical protein n=1 Tax=Frankia sp. R82 TaxID=2950553 RepID=UPI00204459F1|nr:hypothetical protein [Frankia sp. R82]MCM3882708.1 hypothetical protein [Frankia sp. R82]